MYARSRIQIDHHSLSILFVNLRYQTISDQIKIPTSMESWMIVNVIQTWIDSSQS